MRASLCLALLALACQAPPPAESAAHPQFSADKAPIYPLVGRWYTPAEVKRLMDPSLTPEQWCARTPTRLFIEPDHVEVNCDQGEPQSAGIASVTTTVAGEVGIVLRAPKSSPLRRLGFRKISGTRATVTGVPCFGGKPVEHVRFPEYEVLARQILSGKRCSQMAQP